MGEASFSSFPQAHLNKLLKNGSKRDRLSKFLLKRLLRAKKATGGCHGSY